MYMYVERPRCEAALCKLLLSLSTFTLLFQHREGCSEKAKGHAV